MLMKLNKKNPTKLFGFLQLMRPANLPTAAADVLAGIAIAGGYPFHEVLGLGFFQAAFPILLICLVSILLYAGGVVLNDVFDANIDAIERPERPIPRGLIPKNEASFFGVLLLVAGTCLAFLISENTGFIAVILSLGILLYNSLAKRYSVWGPVVMGICRALNLWMGFTLVTSDIPWNYIWIPLGYILAITAVSREEVRGATRYPALLAAIIYIIVILGIGGITYFETGRLLWPGLFLILFAIMLFRPLIQVFKTRTPNAVRSAVKAGVMGVVVMDAAWAAGYGPWWLPLVILLLLPIAMLLAKRFSVT
ncbi:MAG: hypothetical protein RLZZ241_1358 [Bacteroidota bacterium]